MSQERTEAVVLRGTDFSETSRIVTLLTPGRGRFACMAKGARRAKSGVAASLDSLNRVEIVYYWKDGRQVQQLGEACLLSGYPKTKKDLDKSTFSALPVELALNIAHENEPSEELYEAFVQGFESFENWDGDVPTHSAWQVHQLLAAAGFAPMLTHCGGCGKALDRAAGFAFASGAVCLNCPSDTAMPQALWAQLKAFEQAETCPRFVLSPSGLQLLVRYASHQLEREIRCMRVIEEMTGAPNPN